MALLAARRRHDAQSVQDEWLEGRFGDRVISKLNGHTWPSRTPDMSSLDYWPWSLCLAELKRSHSAILDEHRTSRRSRRSGEHEEATRAGRKAGGGACLNMLKRDGQATHELKC